MLGYTARSLAKLIQMARITVEDCLKYRDNRFDLVLTASKRARQIEKGAEPLVDPGNDKPSVIALREIAEGLVTDELLRAVEAEERARAEAEALRWAAQEVDVDLSRADDDL